MKIGVISDLHIRNKTINIEHALTKMQDADILLLVGDIADTAEESQYETVLEQLHVYAASIPVYCVSGNHDNPARDDTNYRRFENRLNRKYPSVIDNSGAFYKYIDENIDIIGLNPVYHQKLFFFPNHGQQLTFLEERLKESKSKYHIVMYHPPLARYNPQTKPGMRVYTSAEQDARLQKTMDENRNIIFLSGHTHLTPVVAFDDVHHNLYINDGSICPTGIIGKEGETQQGNVTILDIKEDGISVIIKGIYTEKVFLEKQIIHM